MEILIFSDSHGDSLTVNEMVSRQVTPPDEIWFLGDGLRDADLLESKGAHVEKVFGNCDWMRADTTATLLLERLGHTIMLTHGHLYGVKSGTETIVKAGIARGADIVLFGHTHTPYLETIPKETEIDGVVLKRPLYLFNPGAVSGYNGSFGTLSLTRETVLLGHGQI